MNRRTKVAALVFAVVVFNLFIFRNSIIIRHHDDESGPIPKPPPTPNFNGGDSDNDKKIYVKGDDDVESEQKRLQDLQAKAREQVEKAQHELNVAVTNLNRCQNVHKLKIVIIDTPQTHEKVRLLVGSIHQHHKGDLKMYIYGLNLPLLLRVKYYCGSTSPFLI